MSMSLTLDQLIPKLAARLPQGAGPYVVGIVGGQGAGKTTLCASLETYLDDTLKRESLTLALDDFYLSADERHAISREVSPLVKTRGVPGTHHVDHLFDCLSRLKSDTPNALYLPRFSKADDTQVEPVFYSGSPSIIFLEGWCIGAHADFVRDRDQTQWEKRNDPDGIWRQWSIAEVEAYYPVWDLLDQLILIRQDNFEAVIDSRWTQEQSNADKSGKWQFKSRAEVADFCAHYETWTEALWAHLPDRADMTIRRDQRFHYFLDV